jgi:hypothetical protein
VRQSYLVRQKISKIVKEAKFPNQEKINAIELCILRAVELKLSYEKPELVELKKVVGRPKKSPYIPIISSAIFRAWRLGTGKKAKVSKRISGTSPNEFVQFATKIYNLVGISNVIDNLDAHRSMGNYLKSKNWVWKLGQK